jgi:hypothetical protein
MARGSEPQETTAHLDQTNENIWLSYHFEGTDRFEETFHQRRVVEEAPRPLPERAEAQSRLRRRKRHRNGRVLEPREETKGPTGASYSVKMPSSAGEPLSTSAPAGEEDQQPYEHQGSDESGDVLPAARQPRWSELG